MQSEIGHTLDALANAVERRFEPELATQRIRSMLAAEFERGAADDRFPLAPARIVADTAPRWTGGTSHSSTPGR
jgi:acetolactate synthase I/II/III large subunit